MRRRPGPHAASIAILIALALLLASAAFSRLAPVQASPAAQNGVYLPLIFRRHVAVDSIFGVRMQKVTDQFGLPQALQAGVHTVSAVTFSWKEIERDRTTPPTYNWTSVDTVSLLNAANSGLELVANIHGTPPWAQAIPGYSCGPIAPEHLPAFAAFLQALVERYGVAPYNVRYWSIWNEPDVDWHDVGPGSTFGCWGDANLPDFGGGAYAQMLQVAYPAIKAVSPYSQVIAGSLLLGDDEGISSMFTQGILEAGGGPYFDALSFHVYAYYRSLGKMDNPNWDGSFTAIPEKTAFLRSRLQAAGFPDKPVLSTEASMLILSNNPSPDSLETQAMYVPRAYAEALALGLDGLVYYSMTDDWPGRNNGLLRADLTKKPSYYAYQAAASFLSQAYFWSPISGYPDGVAGYAFGSLAGRHVDVLWSGDDQAHQVTLPAGAAAHDRYGASLPGRTIQVDYSPVYVVKP